MEALTTAARVSREGGSALVEMPVEGSDETETVEIGKEAAREILGKWLDLISMRMLDAMDADQHIPEIDQQALAMWLAASVPDSQRS